MRRAAALLLLLPLLACAHGGVDIATLSSNSDQVVWEAGQKAYAKKNWESARQHFKRIVDGFPQSQHAPAARLGLADSHFQEGGAGSYILAISEYRDFLTLYPSHPKSDYAQFQVGGGVLQAEERARPGPDPPRRPSPSTSASSTSTRSPPWSSGPAVASASAGRAWRGPSSSPVTSTSGPGRPAGPPSCVTRASSTTTPTSRTSTRCSIDWRSAWVHPARKAEALPHLARLLAEYPTSRFAEVARKLTAEFQKLQGPDAPPAASPVASPVPAPTPSDATPPAPPPPSGGS